MITRTTNPIEVGALLERIGTPDATTTADLVEADNGYDWVWGGGEYMTGWHAWVWGGGVFLMLEFGPLVADVHTYVFPTARGKHAVEAAREAIARELDDGWRLVGRTPVDNIPARRFAALCGGVRVGVENDEEVREWVR